MVDSGSVGDRVLALGNGDDVCPPAACAGGAALGDERAHAIQPLRHGRPEGVGEHVRVAHRLEGIDLSLVDGAVGLRDNLLGVRRLPVAVTALVSRLGSKAHDWDVEVRLLYFDGCPHWSVAEERLRLALASMGSGGQAIERVLVETPEDAERLGFIGSPTVVVNGRDPFAKGGEQSALACRVYSTPQGPAGSPTIEQLVEVLS